MEKKELFNFLYLDKYGETIPEFLAIDIVKDFAVTDGSTRSNGEKWTLKEAVEIGNKLNINWNCISKVEWYVILNNFYSIFYSCYNKKETPENHFGKMALAWFNDINSPENKTFNYIFYSLMT